MIKYSEIISQLAEYKKLDNREGFDTYIENMSLNDLKLLNKVSENIFNASKKELFFRENNK